MGLSSHNPGFRGKFLLLQARQAVQLRAPIWFHWTTPSGSSWRKWLTSLLTTVWSHLRRNGVKEWDAIPQDMIRAACLSFNGRLKAVVKNKGCYLEGNMYNLKAFFLVLFHHEEQRKFCFLVFSSEGNMFVALTNGHTVHMFLVKPPNLKHTQNSIMQSPFSSSP